MKNRGTIIGIAVAAGVLILLGIGFYMNPGGITDRVREKVSALAGRESPSATGHAGHGGGAPAAAPAEKQTAEMAGMPGMEAKPPAGAKQAPAEAAPTVEIPSDRQPMIGMKSVAVSVRALRRTIRTVGRVEYDERRFRTVNAKFEGWIEKLYVDYTGRPVKKGEPLADLYSPELLSTQREYLQLLKWSREPKPDAPSVTDKMVARDAAALAAAARERLKLWDITDEQIRKIAETGEPVRTLTLYSPVDGYVAQKMAVQGMKVMPGEKLFDVADLESLWVIADVYEQDLPLVRPGEEAIITLTASPGKEFRSRIDFINPSLAGDTRTAKVRFNISNPGNLMPQMYTEVEIRINLGRKLTVPDDAVIDTGVRQIVYVDRGEGNFEPREVALGARNEGYREVIRGLKAGEKVAASAAFLVDSEAQLRGVRPLKGR
ncbi:MAG: efflux RND transporter periplasmic adaptor subunit [Deltaproteobacteria bacterium]|nr:efflux RND transporter periplasmic adaptor subunit [Deltaproteobacteria bacterium]